jgi:hypothetical protein
VLDHSRSIHQKLETEAEAVAMAHHKNRHPLMTQEALQGREPHLSPWARTPDTDVSHLAQYVGNDHVGEQGGFDLSLCQRAVDIAAIFQVFDARLHELL